MSGQVADIQFFSFYLIIVFEFYSGSVIEHVILCVLTDNREVDPQFKFIIAISFFVRYSSWDQAGGSEYHNIHNFAFAEST